MIDAPLRFRLLEAYRKRVIDVVIWFEGRSGLKVVWIATQDRLQRGSVASGPNEASIERPGESDVRCALNDGATIGEEG